MKGSAPTYRPAFVPWDIEVARINFGANCGPASFAALTGKEVCRVIGYFPHFEHSNWTNLTQMLRAFDEAGYEMTVHRRAFPVHGVALIQWLGPWTERDFFSRWSLPYTHWIAVEGKWVFDHTVGSWEKLEVWRDETVPEFLSETPRATGWAVKYGVEVNRVEDAALDRRAGARLILSRRR